MKTTVILLVIIFAQYTNCDIPTHCLKSQVHGKWNFFGTKKIKKNLAELYDLTCGHQRPSHESTSFKFNMDKQLFTEKFTIELNEDDSAMLGDKTGAWTMVYDEAFDIFFDKNTPNVQSYFAFLKYGKNDRKDPKINSNWVSYCYASLIGWYREGDEWGCFYGVKDGQNDDEVTNGEATNKQVVLGDASSITAKTFLQTNERNGYDDIRFMQSTFNSKFSSRIELTSKFKEHSQVVERINAMEGSWKAESYSEFKDMTIDQLNKFSGRLKSKISNHENDMYALEGSSYRPNSRKRRAKNSIRRNVISNDLPKEFSWVDYMEKAGSQVYIIIYQ